VYASVTTTQGASPDIPELATMAGETMLEWLREIEGFAGIVMLTNDAGRTQVITFWESQEVAERHMSARLQLRDRITETVNVEVQETGAYVVSFAELPALREPAG
jgi:predicted RNase H-like HicB family nuclease